MEIAGVKPYKARAKDFKKPESRMGSRSELIVITKSKDLIKYIFTITEKSPKKFRFSLVGRMQNFTLDILEALYLANELPVTAPERMKHQRSALTKLKLLDAVAMLAREQQCILPRQYEQVSKRIADCQNLIGAWINSDKKRK